MPTPEEAQRMRELLQYEGQPLPDNKPELLELNASIKKLTEAKELAALSSSGLLGCGVCGGKTVEIRGRYPGDQPRKVCPTCMADRLSDIHQQSSAGYGQASVAQPSDKLCREQGGKDSNDR